MAHLFVDFSEERHGTPKIGEPQKCKRIGWFNIKKLPQDMSFARREAITNYLNGITYSEIHFDEKKKTLDITPTSQCTPSQQSR